MSSTAPGRIEARRDGRVGWIIIDNVARRNAVSLEMWQAMAEAIDAFADDPEVRLLVVRGAGDAAFVSGADISRFGEERATADAARIYGETSERLYRSLADCPKPTIAAIRGWCIGGGAALAIACDLRVAAADATFGIPAARLGLGYSRAILERMVQLMGPARTKDLCFTARRLDAAEALRIGLVDRVVPVDGLDGAIAELAATIADNAPLTMGQIKLTVEDIVKPAPQQDAARTAALIAGCFASADYTEGRTAFMEKRRPVFRGR